MSDLTTIYNCHIHTFTIDHVPSGFPFPLANRLAKTPYIRRPLSAIARLINPFSNRDVLDRYANFVRASHLRTQEDSFKQVRGYYPGNTKFVVLPMDMTDMGYGKPLKDIFAQHAELAELARHPVYGEKIIPFAAVDPRREGILEHVKELVEADEGAFKGIKLYPPVGYRPDDQNLMPVYEFAQSVGIPVMSHCSKGGVKNKKLPKKETTGYADPDNYKGILKNFPNLRLCLAHFGGDGDWESYRKDPWDPGSNAADKSWVAKIFDMINSGEYPGLYTDISYTIFDFERNVDVLKVFMESEAIQQRVLFGSDFYMTEREEFSERELSMRLRGRLGSERYKQIAQTNPEQYLGLN